MAEKRFITKNGLQTQNINFVSPNNTYSILAEMLDSDTIAFSGTSGQLFSITDSLTGTIFSVNDISGIPSIEVLDDGTIRLAQYAGNVGIGKATPTAKLDIADTKLAGSGSLVGSVLNLTQTWNTSGTPTAIKLNVTNANSGGVGRLLDLQVGGTSVFAMGRDGVLRNAGIAAAYADGVCITAQAAARCFAVGYFNGNNVQLGSTTSFGWTAGADSYAALETILVRDAAHTIAQRNGLSAQAFRIYNTIDPNNSANYERGKIAWSGSVLQIGTEEGGTGTARALDLQTDGTTRLNISATTPVIKIGNDANGCAIFSFSGSTYSTPANGTNLGFFSYDNGLNSFGIAFGADSVAPASGSGSHVLFARTFAPISGTALYHFVDIQSTVNQTGGANGITRGVYVRPTLTAAADWRSIETSNNTGWSFYGAGTANSYFGGSIGIGATSPAAKIHAIDNSSNIVAIFGGNRANPIGLKVYNLTTASNSYITLGEDAGTNSTPFYIERCGSTHATTAAQVNIVQTQNAPLTFHSNNAERVRIDGSGNVGVGTIAPNCRLQIVGSGGGGQSVQIDNREIKIRGDGVNHFSIFANRVSNTLTFDVSGSSSGMNVADSNIMTLAGGGNVGIGNTAPSQKLHVTGNLRLTGAYYDSNNDPGTSGQVLSSTVTGTNWVSLSEITGVDGTGTANYVAKWSDADTITNSQLFDNGTNVGIGTTSPSARLHVVTASNITTGMIIQGDVFGDNYRALNLRNFNSGFEQVELGFQSGNISAQIFDLATIRAVEIDRTAASEQGELRFYTINSGSLTQKMVIAGAGNVGIGTTSPLQLLHVAGDINVSSGSGFRINNTATSGEYLRGNGTRFVSSAIQAADVPTLNQNTTGSAGTLLYTDNRIISPNELASNRMSFGFTSYNNNNSSPYADFIHLRSYQDATGGLDNLLVFNKSTGIGMRLYQQTWNSATAYATYKDVVLAANTPTVNYLTKYSVAGDAVTVANSQIFDDGTNVGINTSSPLTKLDVRSGSITVGTQISTSGSELIRGFYTTTDALTVIGTEHSSGGPVIGYAVKPSTSSSGAFLSTTGINVARSAYSLRGGNHSWFVGTGGIIAIDSAVSMTEAMVLTNAGNVGMGVTSPAAKLHIRRTSGDFIRLGVSDANADAIEGRIEWYTNEAVSADYFGGLKMRFQGGSGANNRQMQFLVGDSATPKVVITGQGFVGVGTTSPRARLNVSSSINTVVEPILGADTNSTAIFANSANAYGLNIVCSGSGVVHLQNQRFDGNTATYQLILNGYGGNVGIGNTNPTERLVVGGTGDIAAVVTSTAGGARLRIRSSNNYDELTFGATDQMYIGGWPHSGNMQFGTASTERMRITSTGSVGIGTTSPSQLLHVAGGNFRLEKSDSPIFEIHRGATRQGYLWSFAGSYLELAADNRPLYLTTGGSNPIYLAAGGTEKARLTSDGNLGVGITSPKAKIHSTNALIAQSFLGGSYYHYSNGILIRTDIAVSDNRMFELTIEGNSYNDSKGPVFARVQAYNYITSGTIINTSAFSTDPSFTIDVFHYDGFVYFWFAQTGSFQTYTFKLISPMADHTITTVANIAKPTTGVTNSVTITPAKLWNSLNDGAGSGLDADTLDGQQLSSIVSGTTNYVSKFTSANAIGNSQIFDNGTNVGIGTTSPATLVHANTGSSAADVIRITNGTQSLNLGVNNSAGGSYIFEIANQALRFGTNNSERMRISGSGDVGIGISSPSAALDVKGLAASGYSLLLRSGDGSTGTGAVQMAFGYNNTAEYRHSIRTRHDSGGATNNAIDFWLWRQGTDSSTTLGSLRAMTISGANSGSVGIGTTSPSYKLHVSGGAIYSAGDGLAVAYYIEGGSAIRVPSASAGSTVFFDSPNIHFRNPANGAATLAYLNSSGNFGIGTTSPSEKLHVVGNGYFVGYVGINQTPSTFYDIITSGPIRSNTAYIAASNTGYYALGSSSDVVLTRDAAGTLAQRDGLNAQAFRVYNTIDPNNAANYERGKFAWNSSVLEIGTESAGTGTARGLVLQTNGLTQLTIAANGIITTTNALYIGSTANGIVNASANGTGNESVFICSQSYSATAGSRTIFSSTNNFQPTSGTLTYTGVGISPTINQTGGANGITRGVYINPNLTAAANWRSIETSNATGWAIYTAGAANSYFGGNVGIGTVSPSQKLSVAGNALIGTEGSTRIVIRGDGNGTNPIAEYYQSEANPRWAIGRDMLGGGGAGIGFGDSTNTIAAGGAAVGNPYPTSRALAFYTSNATSLVERMRIDGSGNVGIGTTSPSVKLDVNGGETSITSTSTNPTLSLTNTTASNDPYIRFKGPDSSPTYAIGIDSSDSNKFKINGGYLVSAATLASSNIITITEYGLVGLGTTNPGAKLEVNGVAYFRSGANAVNVYVFNYAGADNEHLKIGWGSTGSNQAIIDVQKEGAGVYRDLVFKTSDTERVKVAANGIVDIKNALRLSGSSSGYVGLVAAAAAGSTTYTLPASDGTADQVLKTDGSGNLSWTTPSGGGITNEQSIINALIFG